MSFKRPGIDALEAISDYYGFDLASDELHKFQSAVTGSMAIYDRFDELADESLPVKYQRADLGYRSLDDDNPMNGWAWKCFVQRAENGKERTDFIAGEGPGILQAGNQKRRKLGERMA